MCLHSAYEVGGVVHSRDLPPVALRDSAAAAPAVPRTPTSAIASNESRGADHG